MNINKTEVETINTEAVDKLFLKENHQKSIVNILQLQKNLADMLVQKSKLELELADLTSKAKEAHMYVINEGNNVSNTLNDVYGAINIIDIETGEYVETSK